MGRPSQPHAQATGGEQNAFNPSQVKEAARLRPASFRYFSPPTLVLVLSKQQGQCQPAQLASTARWPGNPASGRTRQRTGPVPWLGASLAAAGMHVQCTLHWTPRGTHAKEPCRFPPGPMNLIRRSGRGGGRQRVIPAATWGCHCRDWYRPNPGGKDPPQHAASGTRLETR